MSIFPDRREQPVLYVLAIFISIALFAFLAAQTANTIREGAYIGQTETSNTIAVSGKGEVDVKPDIATFSISVTTDAATAEKAKEDNAKIMNAVIADLKELDIEKADLKTESVSVYENTVWNPSTNTYESNGWQAYQNLSVTVRDLENTDKVLDIATKQKDTSVSGPNFSVENPEEYLAEARENAIEQAREKADQIADSLDLTIDAVVSYYEYQDGGYYPMYESMAADMGRGGAVELKLEEGEQTITLNVDVTYRLR